MKTPFLLLLGLTLSLPALATPSADFAARHGDRAKWSDDDNRQYDQLVAKEEQDANLAKLKIAGKQLSQNVKTGVHKVGNALDDAWDKIEQAGAGVRSGMEQAFLAVQKGAENVADAGQRATVQALHKRPFLFSEYIDYVKKGDRVSLLYCDSRLANIVSPNGQSCEKLSAGSFKVSDLKSCLAMAGENKGPGMNLNKNLNDSMFKDDRFDVGHFKMFYAKDEYKDYLAECRQNLAAKEKTVSHATSQADDDVAQPAPTGPIPLPPPSPVDHSNDQPATVEHNGTL